MDQKPARASLAPDQIPVVKDPLRAGLEVLLEEGKLEVMHHLLSVLLDSGNQEVSDCDCSSGVWVEEVSEFLHREDLIQPAVFTHKIPPVLNLSLKFTLFLTPPILSVHTISVLTKWGFFFQGGGTLICSTFVDPVGCRKNMPMSF